MLLVTALDELLDDLRAEGRQVVGLAARDEPVVDDDFLVDPRRAGIPQVGLQARPRRDLPASRDVCLDEYPGPVADDPDRLVLLEEVAYEADGVGIGAEVVGVGDTARDHEAVVVRRIRVGDGEVGRRRCRPCRDG